MVSYLTQDTIEGSRREEIGRSLSGLRQDEEEESTWVIRGRWLVGDSDAVDSGCVSGVRMCIR